MNLRTKPLLVFDCYAIRDDDSNGSTVLVTLVNGATANSEMCYTPGFWVATLPLAAQYSTNPPVYWNSSTIKEVLIAGFVADRALVARIPPTLANETLPRAGFKSGLAQALSKILDTRERVARGEALVAGVSPVALDAALAAAAAQPATLGDVQNKAEEEKEEVEELEGGMEKKDELRKVEAKKAEAKKVGGSDKLEVLDDELSKKEVKVEVRSADSTESANKDKKEEKKSE
jgi:hypothetical protein